MYKCVPARSDPSEMQKSQKLLHSLHIFTDNLADSQIMVHIRIMIHFHKIKGQITRNPSISSADHHIGLIKNPVFVHKGVNRSSVRLSGILPIELQNLFLILRFCIGKP